MLTRWNDPTAARWSNEATWDALSDLRREMNQLFREFDRSWMGGVPFSSRGMPALEMTDDGDALTVQVELPGFAQDDVQIDLDRSTLSIRGQRNTEVPEGYSVHRQERGSLAFARTLSLPCRVDADQVSAELRDGVLWLRLPKAPEEKPRTIEVRSTN